MESVQRTELSGFVLADILHVIQTANDFALNVVSTNSTTVLLDMKIDIDGFEGVKVGSVVWSNSEESFVFVPEEQD